MLRLGKPIQGEVLQPAVCKPAVTKQRWKMTTGALPALPTSLHSVEFWLGRPINLSQTKGNIMKPVLRYQSQLLFRKSYKPNRVRIKPAKLNFAFRPVRFGIKPQIIPYKCDST